MRTAPASAALSLISLVTLAAAPALADPVEWAIDGAHTRASFTVPHLVVSEVDGHLKELRGTVKLDEADLTKSTVELTIPVASISTENADRDKHLRSADFFDAEKYPSVSFKATKIVKAGQAYKITGDLTMRGVTKPVTLDGAISDAVTNPWGKQVRGVKVTGKVKRQDFGLRWNKALDKGGVLVGDDVTLRVTLELNR